MFAIMVEPQRDTWNTKPVGCSALVEATRSFMGRLRISVRAGEREREREREERERERERERKGEIKRKASRSPPHQPTPTHPTNPPTTLSRDLVGAEFALDVAEHGIERGVGVVLGEINSTKSDGGLGGAGLVHEHWEIFTGDPNCVGVGARFDLRASREQRARN